MNTSTRSEPNSPRGGGTSSTEEIAAAATDRELLDRFVERRDEQAFAALVRRHGSMVLGVCRRILESAEDAEDAFQATFVVLARKAHLLDRPERVAGWLHGVACHIARKARVQAARRRFHEREAALISPAIAHGAVEDTKEIRAILAQGLERLPAKYRLPLILCYLHEMTNQEAARKLGWPAGSMSYRLARGRELLRSTSGTLCSAPD
jgi:RNA polymerase sigma factor (sigma-70 family)